MRKIVTSDLPSKDEVAARFAHFPSIEKLVLVLLYDWRFRLAIVGLVIVGAAFALVLVPIWRSTPRGFKPVQRIKLLDVWQARSLRHTARAEIAAGRAPDGLVTMRAAVSNNPGDLDMLREFITQIRTYGDPRKHAHMAVQNGFWLVRLSGTNTADLELVAGLFERFYLEDIVVAMLEPMEDKLTPALEKAYAKALFMNRDPVKFAMHLARLHTQGVAANDPELELFDAAYLAGWTDGASARSGQDKLDRGKDRPELALLAQRLQLIVSERRNDAESYGKALEDVIQHGAVRIIDHLVYWGLLNSAGQKEKAVEIMRSNVYEPRSGDEAILLARSYYEFGLPEEALAVLQRYARFFAFASHLWLSLGNLLIAQENWDDLGRVALEIRDESNPSRSELLSLSYYFEGLSELKRHRDSTAVEAFEKAAQAPCDNESILLRIAAGMSEVGQPGPAQQLLLKNQRMSEKNPEYWNILGKVSFELRDLPTLAYAAAKTHSLKPDDPAAIQNHAAALLSMRSMPQQAIALTLESYRREPNNTGVILNHAAALTQNRRFAEARRLLMSLDKARLSESEKATLNLVLFELCLEEGNHGEALKAASSINRSALFPPETQWLDNTLRRISTNKPSAGAAPPQTRALPSDKSSNAVACNHALCPGSSLIRGLDTTVSVCPWQTTTTI